MIQTKKNYTLEGNNYIEDPNGFIIGYNWVDNSGISRRCLYIESIDDLVNRTVSAKCRYEMLDPKNNEWILRNTETSIASMDSYVYGDGTLEPNPLEDDLNSPIYVDDLNDPIYDVDLVTVIGYNQIISGYNQKLKDGLIPEFAFFYAAQLPIFSGVMAAIQARKFGATGFN